MDYLLLTDSLRFTPSRGWTLRLFLWPQGRLFPMYRIICSSVQFEVKSLPRAKPKDLFIELRVRIGALYRRGILRQFQTQNTYIFFEHRIIFKGRLTSKRTILRNLCETLSNIIIYLYSELIYYDIITVNNSPAVETTHSCIPLMELRSCPVRNQMVPQRV